jgi:hypothetical protein
MGKGSPFSLLSWTNADKSLFANDSQFRLSAFKTPVALN